MIPFFFYIIKALIIPDNQTLIILYSTFLFFYETFSMLFVYILEATQKRVVIKMNQIKQN